MEVERETASAPLSHPPIPSKKPKGTTLYLLKSVSFTRLDKGLLHLKSKYSQAPRMLL